jgi:phosphate transport system ATP-binding protein
MIDANEHDAQGGIFTRDLNLWYGEFQALKAVTTTMARGQVTGLIGPSGCGKTTLLRCFNRINERIPGVRTSGRVEILGSDVYAPGVDLIELRKRVGMVFQRPNPLPIPVAENLLFGLRIHTPHRLGRAAADAAIESALREVSLWNDLKDRLHHRATELSLEQQQKLCIARLLPLKPEVLLMDEPCSALDPTATQRVEELIRELRGRYTILIVTHNMAQARRVSDDCIFMLLGEMVEHRRTEDLFLNPGDERTARYIEGRYG